MSAGGTVRQDLGLIQRIRRGSTGQGRQTYMVALGLSMMSETEEVLLHFSYDLPIIKSSWSQSTLAKTTLVLRS